MDISIVIVNYNTWPFLDTCLRSIKSGTECQHEVIVVDNNSCDGSGKMLRERYPEVTLIRNQSNAGFARANNQGFSVASGNYFLMLNPDTIVLPAALDKLVDFMNNNADVGICGPRNVDPEGNLQYSCDYFPGFFKSLWAYTNIANRYPRIKTFQRQSQMACDYSSVQDVDKIMGCSLMIRSALYKEVGGLDNNYFMYFEETDLCYQVKKLGHRVTYVPTAAIVHFHGESSKSQTTQRVVNKTITSYFYESQYYFFRKNYGFWPMVAIGSLDLLYGIALVLRNTPRKDQVKRKLGLDRGKALCSAFLENTRRLLYGFLIDAPGSNRHDQSSKRH